MIEAHGRKLHALEDAFRDTWAGAGAAVLAVLVEIAAEGYGYSGTYDEAARILERPGRCRMEEIGRNERRIALRRERWSAA